MLRFVLWDPLISEINDLNSFPFMITYVYWILCQTFVQHFLFGFHLLSIPMVDFLLLAVSRSVQFVF